MSNSSKAPRAITRAQILETLEPLESLERPGRISVYILDWNSHDRKGKLDPPGPCGRLVTLYGQEAWSEFHAQSHAAEDWAEFMRDPDTVICLRWVSASIKAIADYLEQHPKQCAEVIDDYTALRIYIGRLVDTCRIDFRPEDTTFHWSLATGVWVTP